MGYIITSTDFSKAYRNETIIIKASKANGKLTKEFMIYLCDENSPIEVKMALINELGWNSKGKANSVKFFKYLKRTEGFSTESDFFKNGNSGELLCMGYLKAMENYFEVDDALRYAEDALSKTPKSYTFQIITGLIRAQKSLNKDWCKVYKMTNEVRSNVSLDKDMKDEAIAIIFEYMDIYKESCKM